MHTGARVRFDPAELDRFTVADVLTAFSLPAEPRVPCPLCLTSRASLAFSHRGVLWRCFACGESGNAVGLYSRLAGCSAGEAIRAIAGHLGISPRPVDGAFQARVEAARRAREDEDEAREIAGVRWRARLRLRDRLRADAAGIPDSPLGRAFLEGIHAKLGPLEDWIECQLTPADAW